MALEAEVTQRYLAALEARDGAAQADREVLFDGLRHARSPPSTTCKIHLRISALQVGQIPEKDAGGIYARSAMRPPTTTITPIIAKTVRALTSRAASASNPCPRDGLVDV